MPASFTLTPEDFRLFQRAVGRRFLRAHGRFGVPFFLNVLAWFCVSMAVMTFFRLLDQTAHSVRPFGVLVGAMFAGFLAAVVMPHAAQRRFMRYALSPRGSFLAPQTVQVSENALFFTSGASRAEVPWSSVLARDEDDRNHYLFMDATYAIVIPKHAAVGLGPLFEKKVREIGIEA